ncbi:uncharacterized protein LOC115414162 isoform X1 [Sphaeramia orbicularis]|uniref:uncharacterized protein LOC115414162 isoform X1 n=1 Tax=Sphaeramia orbicularis TaxID=375764 RepID=UPI00117ED9F4|nr:uncharacterized protein LOC115414162 isoform X1 [Sphaeramia orbicularis]
MSVRLTSETPALGGKAQLHSDSFSLGLRIMLLWTTLYKAATDHYNQLSYPGQMDPAVSTKCQNYRLVSATVSSVDKCVECLGLISSYKWLGYVCKDEIVFSDAEASARESDDCSTAVTATECGTVEPMDTDATIKEQVHDMEDFGQDACEDQHRRVPKKVWLKAEVAAVLRHFRDHIQKGKLATKNECSQCKLVEGPVLAQRTVQNIRDFVRNRGIAAKRQSEKKKL